VQKFSIHWKADLDRAAAPACSTSPALWKAGWPVAGENTEGGHVRRSNPTALGTLRSSSAVEELPVGRPARRRGAMHSWKLADLFPGRGGQVTCADPLRHGEPLDEARRARGPTGRNVGGHGQRLIPPQDCRAS